MSSAIEPAEWRFHQRSADYGAIDRDQWRTPVVSEFPEPELPFSRVILQNEPMRDMGIAWEFQKLDDGWMYMGGPRWSTYSGDSANQVSVNEGTLASAFSTDRYSVLDHFIVPVDGEYDVSFMLNFFQDSNANWYVLTSVIADISSGSAVSLMSASASSYGGTIDTYAVAGFSAPLTLTKGQELALYSYRNTGIWTVIKYAFHITPRKLNLT